MRREGRRVLKTPRCFSISVLPKLLLAERSYDRFHSILFPRARYTLAPLLARLQRRRAINFYEESFTVITFKLGTYKARNDA